MKKKKGILDYTETFKTYFNKEPLQFQEFEARLYYKFDRQRQLKVIITKGIQFVEHRDPELDFNVAGFNVYYTLNDFIQLNPPAKQSIYQDIYQSYNPVHWHEHYEYEYYE